MTAPAQDRAQLEVHPTDLCTSADLSPDALAVATAYALHALTNPGEPIPAPSSRRLRQALAQPVSRAQWGNGVRHLIGMGLFHPAPDLVRVLVPWDVWDDPTRTLNHDAPPPRVLRIRPSRAGGTGHRRRDTRPHHITLNRLADAHTGLLTDDAPQRLNEQLPWNTTGVAPVVHLERVTWGGTSADHKVVALIVEWVRLTGHAADLRTSAAETNRWRHALGNVKGVRVSDHHAR